MNILDKQTAEARKMMKKLPLKEKLSNFWFYYKKHTIIGIIATIVISVSVADCVMRVEDDLSVSLFANYGVSQGDIDALKEIFKRYSYDIIENGSVDINIVSYTGDITQEIIDQTAQAAMMKMDLEIASNECPAYLVDEAYKKRMEGAYSDIIKDVIKINDIPKISEKLNLTENIYFVTMTEYKNAQKDKVLMAKYKLIDDLVKLFKVK